MDILATALGKPDYPGRVVGEPGRVSAKKYFGKKARAPTRRETAEEIEARVYARVAATFEARFAMLEEQYRSNNQTGGTSVPQQV